MSGLDYERVVLSAGPLGIMPLASMSSSPISMSASSSATDRRVQLMQGKLADMYVTTNAARAYVYAVAAACDRGETARKDAAGCILYAAEKATAMALEAIQALGGQRLHQRLSGRPAGCATPKLYEIGGGHEEIRRMLIGRELFAETK